MPDSPLALLRADLLEPDEVAEEAKGFQNLYTGLDLSGWKADEEAKNHWQPRDTVLHYDGKGGPLTTAKAFGDTEFIIDYRFSKETSEPCAFLLRGSKNIRVTLSPAGRMTASAGGANGATDAIAKGPGSWNRLRLRMEGGALRVELNDNGGVVVRSDGLPESGALTLSPGSAMDFANPFVRELK